jgi:thiol-disulfide isomerase/thioredoxin
MFTWRKMMRKKVTLISLLVLILSLSLIMACGDAKSNAETDAKTDKAASDNAKDFTLTLLDGKKLTLNDLKGKAVIIDVWDTWCPPCKAEIPHFIALYDEYKDKGLVIIGLAGGRDGKDAVEKFIVDYGINYLNAIFDPQFNQAYGPINSIPTTFVLDKKGNVYKKYVGYKDKAVFEADIKEILGI